MISLLQPTNNTCGQTVVAMIVGVTPEEIIGKLGQRKTYPICLRKILAEYGWTMERRPSLKLPDTPCVPAIVKLDAVINHRVLGHWVLWDGRKYMDPARGNLDKSFFGTDCSGMFYRITKGV